jgi:hypothetical protein
MKYVIAALLGLFSLTAFAGDATHWVRILEVNTSKGTSVVYLDDSQVITEDGYSGFKILTVLPISSKTSDGTVNIVSVVSVLEINCGTDQGRGRRLTYIADDNTAYPAADPEWKTIIGPPATDTLVFVKRRVCLNTL